MKILNFGSCNIDYVYSLDHIVNPGETETTFKLETFPGGKGLNQSIALARAGVKVYHAGCIGKDGNILIDILEESGVDVSNIKNVDAKNGHAIIQVSSKGENSIFLYPGSNEMVCKDFIDSVMEEFEEGDIILLQNEISNVDYIIERAHQRKMCIILNPSPVNEKISKIDLNKISYIILNEIEIREISECSNYKEALRTLIRKYPSLKIMLTLGDQGCIYKDKEHEVYQNSFKVDVVDTTAAGDTFTGYFVAGISNATNYNIILELASAASAIAVSRSGAAPSIPNRDEVINSMEKLKENVINKK